MPHEGKSIPRGDAVLALSGLFEFVEWVDYCYGAAYEERRFDERLIPAEKVAVDAAALAEREALLARRDAEIEQLQAQVERMRAPSCWFVSGIKVHANISPLRCYGVIIIASAICLPPRSEKCLVCIL